LRLEWQYPDGPAALNYDDRNGLSGWNLMLGQVNLSDYATVYGYNRKGERTVGFETLARKTKKPSKSLHRMLSSDGNPHG
jgi:hypothetical protein